MYDNKAYIILNGTYIVLTDSLIHALQLLYFYTVILQCTVIHVTFCATLKIKLQSHIQYKYKMCLKCIFVLTFSHKSTNNLHMMEKITFDSVIEIFYLL